MMTNNLIIFVKYPEPGQVKTRIGEIIGFEKAADIYSSLTNYIFNNLKGSPNFSISVCFTPENKKNNIKSWFNNSDLIYFSQVGKTLGERISNAFDYSFSKGFNNTVVIGSDCVELNNETVKAAFNHLKGSECVIGPTYDGGYYLIGLKSNSCPLIFENISWSSSSVFEETLTKIQNLDLKYIVLEKLNDVDDINDINNNVIDLVKNYYPNFEV